MNLFTRFKDAVTNAWQRAKEKRAAKKELTTVSPERDKTRRLNVSWERAGLGGVRRRTIKGPAFVPSAEYHHTSRQTCRAYLRGLFFAQLSQQYPGAPRAQRRRVARMAASAEYRRMVGDVTNRIPDDDVALAVTA
jgi:hypothetical protein